MDSVRRIVFLKYKWSFNEDKIIDFGIYIGRPVRCDAVLGDDMLTYTISTIGRFV